MGVGVPHLGRTGLWAGVPGVGDRPADPDSTHDPRWAPNGRGYDATHSRREEGALDALCGCAGLAKLAHPSWTPR